MSAESRRTPRFLTATDVEVQLAGSEELKELWMRDISKGGLFVATEAPPPLHARVQVRLQTPGGVLALEAEVVHVIDAAMAGAIGHVPGVGLQFLDLDAEKRAALDAYIQGISKTLDAGKRREGADAAVVAARRLLSKVDAGDLYGAVGVAAATSDADVCARLDELAALFSRALLAVGPVERARLEAAGRVLGRVRMVLGDVRRRLDYDLRTGAARPEDRLFAPGADAAALREAWRSLFPERVQEAARLATRALRAVESGRFSEAAEAGKSAVENDPFNLELREAARTWARLARG